MQIVTPIAQNSILSFFEGAFGRGLVPRTCLFIGPDGQGKRTVAQYISESIMGAIYSVHETPKIDEVRDIIDSSYDQPSARVYIITNVHNMTNQAQNALLKFTEEPSPNVYIFMTTIDEHMTLTTIVSRSVRFHLNRYSYEDLKELTDNDDILRYVSNPGELRRFESIDYTELVQTATKIVNNIHKVSAANVFNILQHIKVEDTDLLIPIMVHLYEQKLYDGVNTYQELQLLSKYKYKLQVHSAAKKNLLEILFIDLRRVTKG